MSPPRRIHRWPLAIILLLVIAAGSATSLTLQVSCDDSALIASLEASSTNDQRQFTVIFQNGLPVTT